MYAPIVPAAPATDNPASPRPPRRIYPRPKTSAEAESLFLETLGDVLERFGVTAATAQPAPPEAAR